MTAPNENALLAGKAISDNKAADTQIIPPVETPSNSLKPGSYFQHHGPALLANGYFVVPIKRGFKRPALNGWRTARLGAADLPRYPAHGIGVLCGQGAQPVVAIDVDTTDGALAARFVAWCREHLGATCERVGNAPKVLLTYRATTEGEHKVASAWFARQWIPGPTGGHFSGGYTINAEGKPEHKEPVHRLEILGDGQQFVAYHTHPDTGRPYEWVDIFGGLEAMRADELPAITAAQADEARRVFEAMAAEAGLTKKPTSTGEVGGIPPAPDDDPLMNHKSPIGISLDEARRMVTRVDNEDYDTWLKAGMALHHEFGGGVAALDLWEQWSSTASNYASREDLEKRWRGFGRSVSNPTTARWLLMVAKQGGYQVGAANRLRRPRTEFGNAERMLDRYGDGLMYIPEIDGWFMWTGIYWRRAAEVEIRYLASETVRALPDEAQTIEDDAERSDFLKFCAVSQRAVMVRNMVSLSQCDARVVVGMAELDKHTHLFGVGNGVVNLRTGGLQPADRADRVTTITTTEYDPNAVCPLFEQTVADVFFGDADMIGFFQRLVGYSLLGKPDEDVLAIPYGSGSNGKSTVLGAIRDTLGAHAKMASSETFLSSGVGGSNAGAAREDVLRLRGARFVYVSEPDEGSELREGLIKSMTGGEPLPARGVYSKTTVEVAPTWVAFMPTNHRPIVKGDDHAIWRRLLPVPFTRNFDQDLTVVKDPDRAEKLAAEARGILAWCVRGALAYQAAGLQPPGAVRKARDDYKSDMDLLGEWLDECCEVGPNHVEANTRLWASWEAFSKARGELRFIPSAKVLGRRLQAKGMEGVMNSHGLRGRGRLGLRLRAAGDFE